MWLKRLIKSILGVRKKEELENDLKKNFYNKDNYFIYSSQYNIYRDYICYNKIFYYLNE